MFAGYETNKIVYKKALSMISTLSGPFYFGYKTLRYVIIFFIIIFPFNNFNVSTPDKH